MKKKRKKKKAVQGPWRKKRARDAELVIKQRFCVDASQDNDIAVPELLLLATRAGFRELGQYFTALGDRNPCVSDDPLSDPDDHHHLDSDLRTIINNTLSDRWFFRVGYLTQENRKAACELYGISGDKAERGDLVERFARLAKRAKAYMSGTPDPDTASVSSAVGKG